MKQSAKIHLFVALVVTLALALGASAWVVRAPSPGIWELASFVVIAFLLDQSSTKLKVEAFGSTSFVIHMAGALLFGAFWGAGIAATSTILTGLAIGSPAVKVTFNAAQRALSVLVAVSVYTILGGGLPPAYLQMVGRVDTAALQVDLLLFFVFVST